MFGFSLRARTLVSIHSRKGVSVIEYGVLTMFMSGIAIGGTLIMGDSLAPIYEKASSSVRDVSGFGAVNHEVVDIAESEGGAEPPVVEIVGVDPPPQGDDPDVGDAPPGAPDVNCVVISLYDRLIYYGPDLAVLLLDVGRAGDVVKAGTGNKWEFRPFSASPDVISIVISTPGGNAARRFILVPNSGRGDSPVTGYKEFGGITYVAASGGNISLLTSDLHPDLDDFLLRGGLFTPENDAILDCI